MNWSDERYVRLYQRDTPDWLLWPWQSRALFPLLLRKADRAGRIPFGRHGARGLAVLVALPPEVVEPGLAGLVEDGCVVDEGDTLCLRNYVAAQEARTSDRVRQQASRERRASRAVTPEPPCHTMSHDVTPHPAESQHVTPSLAKPSLAKPKRCADASASSPPPADEPGPPAEPEAEPQRTLPALTGINADREVWLARWNELTEVPPEERTLTEAQAKSLAVTYANARKGPKGGKPRTAETLLRALEGAMAKPFWRSKLPVKLLSGDAIAEGLTSARDGPRHAHRPTPTDHLVNLDDLHAQAADHRR